MPVQEVVTVPAPKTEINEQQQYYSNLAQPQYQHPYYQQNQPRYLPQQQSGQYYIEHSKPEKPTHKKVWFWLLMVFAFFILILILAIAVSAGSSSVKSSSENSPPSQLETSLAPTLQPSQPSVELQESPPFLSQSETPSLSSTQAMTDTPLQTFEVGNVVIQYWGYFDDGVKNILSRDGKTENFTIINENDYEVAVLWEIVGVKKDGNVEQLTLGWFNEPDTVQFEKDLAENGWAIMHTTLRIRANSSMTSGVIFTSFIDTIPDLDVDHDGYYDIRFAVHRQDSDTDSFTVSTTSPVSDIYSIKAN